MLIHHREHKAHREKTQRFFVLFFLCESLRDLRVLCGEKNIG